jgi:glycerate 2-kinase
VKGGQLARRAAPAKVISLILSDVVGDSLEVIASGPTVPDGSTYAQALDILEKYNLKHKTAKPILDILSQGCAGEIPETPKPGDRLFQNVQNVIVGSNCIAAQAAKEQAQAEGFNTLLLTTYLQGEARQAGMFLGSILRQIVVTGEPLARPACVITGGETTVTLQGSGCGGRNQELALGAVSELRDLEDVALLSLATDGGDGPTDAAGAAATGQTMSRALAAGLSPADNLTRNDSYHFFKTLDDLFITGPTQTNVNDLQFLFAF